MSELIKVSPQDGVVQEYFFWRHPDRYEEDVLELISNMKFPNIKSVETLKFLITGDPNSGKTTLLNILANAGNINHKHRLPYLLLSSYFPILGSSFTNSRYLEKNEKADTVEKKCLPNYDYLVGVYDFPNEDFIFLNTDIARVNLLLDNADFNSLSNDFNIFLKTDAAYVGFEIVELGGDHLNRFISKTDLVCDAEIHAETENVFRTTQNIIYFANLETFFTDSSLNAAELKLFLKRLDAISQNNSNIFIYFSRLPQSDQIDYKSFHQNIFSSVAAVFPHLDLREFVDNFNLIFNKGCLHHSSTENLLRFWKHDVIKKDFTQIETDKFIEQLTKVNHDVIVRSIRPFEKRISLLGVLLFLSQLLGHLPCSEAEITQTIVKSALVGILVYIESYQNQCICVNEVTFSNFLMELHGKYSIVNNLSSIHNMLPQDLTHLWPVLEELFEPFFCAIKNSNQGFVRFPVVIHYNEEILEHNLEPGGSYLYFGSSQILRDKLCGSLKFLLGKTKQITKKLFLEQFEIMWDPILRDSKILLENKLCELYNVYIANKSDADRVSLLQAAFDVHLLYKRLGLYNLNQSFFTNNFCFHVGTDNLVSVMILKE